MCDLMVALKHEQNAYVFFKDLTASALIYYSSVLYREKEDRGARSGPGWNMGRCGYFITLLRQLI